MDDRITTIIVRFPVKPGKHKEFLVELRKLLEKLRQEKTFVEAKIHQDLDDPSIIVFYETYSESRESFLKRVPYEFWFQAFLERLPSLLQRKREVFWNEQISTIA